MDPALKTEVLWVIFTTRCMKASCVRSLINLLSAAVLYTLILYVSALKQCISYIRTRIRIYEGRLKFSQMHGLFFLTFLLKLLLFNTYSIKVKYKKWLFVVLNSVIIRTFHNYNKMLVQQSKCVKNTDIE